MSSDLASQSDEAVIRFADFELDTRVYELRKSGLPIHLQPQPCRVLALLASHPGRVFTREEIQREIWGEHTYVDFEQGLNVSIRQIRAALNDDPEKPRFVETLSRRGYRFLAKIEAGPSSASVRPVTPTPQVLRTAEWTHKRRWVALGVVALAAFIAAITLLVRVRSPAGSTASAHIRSIAVLPLENLSGDPGQDYFVEGMHEALITELSKISALKVISRASTMRYKGTEKPLPQVARELSVDGVVEGSVLRDGDQVRITVRLVHGSTNRYLWGENYQRELRRILALQSEVARAIAWEIQVKVTPAESTRLAGARPVNPEAYELYLRGRYFWRRLTAKDAWKTLGSFERAIEKDPFSALAYSGLADAYSFLGNQGFAPPREVFPKAKAAALRAVELDEDLAEAHTALARVYRNYDWDWLRAEAEYRRAIELNPNTSSGNAYGSYANLLTLLGRHEEAIAMHQRARELDPVAVGVGSSGFDFYFARRYDEAIEEIRKALELNPNDGEQHTFLGKAYLQKGARKEAIAELERGFQLLEEAGVTGAGAELTYAYALSGQPAEASKVLAGLMGFKQPYFRPYRIALAYTGLGEKERAFVWLGRAYAERDPNLFFINAEPMLDPLRPDPRFQDLLRRMNFPEN